MVGPSKILTVSYGTFSCTLEGFDEPFDTMKAIAEYFRDLAAEDRYFGAEPPTPDAEMLHKIAEREIKRRVEAKIQDNGVILRPQIEAAEEAPMPRATMHQRPAAAAPVAAAASMVSAPMAAAGLAERDEAGSISGISAKLQRIRAAVARVRDYEDGTEEEAAPAPLALTPEAPLFDEEEDEAPTAQAEADAEEARLVAEDAARLEAERLAFDEAARLEAERLAAEEEARLEAERLAAEEAARLEAERLAAEEEARLEAERLAAEEEARLEAERLAAEEEARLEAERLAAEEEARLEAKRFAAEEEARLEAERLAAEEAARLEAERLAAEEAARLEAERLAAEEAARLEAERLAAEEAARLEAERLAAEEAARLEAERLAGEEEARLEAERLAAEEAARLEADRLTAEQESRATAELAAIEAAALASLERRTAETQTPEAEATAPEAADAERERLAAERRKLEDEIRAEIAKRDGAAPAERPVRRVVVVRSTPVQPAPQPAPQSETAAAPQGSGSDVSAAVRAALAAQAVTSEPTPAPAAPPAPVQSTASAFATEGFADEDDEEDDTPAPAQAADRAEADAEVIDDDEPLTDDDALQRRVAEALGETGLTAEEEAALVAELAAVEREAETARRAENERRALLRGEAADASVDRLISQADSALSGAEAQRRQSTLSHLKAAVVATRAEEEAGAPRDAEQEERDEIARYRADLERSVRRGADEPADEGAPRRPARPQVHRTERPRNAQPPLVLVSEQRIDKPAETELVRPRRINTGALAMEELFDEEAVVTPAPRGKAFGDFVGPMHLTTLAELTEAAAAYVTHVEGLEEFSRPQVMRHVVSTGQPMTRSRENLLRTFGLLMRQGTMQRSRRGQFELAPGSEFAEQAKRFAQA
ncbi:hypothetical protein [Pararhodobacter aggregans]|uniref:Chemotaxis protein CheA n=1 Tax=Pararhodobacter aggregans TaxID=404875 RepID=A0A2T7UN50_9RHOB|nr:hypothetical protein [Pararhodobacter aggregans]PTX02532.1 hypothetical protein C8N33_105355 [Pararhodobacter aggregans]PVE46135.1 hypothetical protein DDE23_18265 [Pararhodobacter aggregans]